MDSAAAAPKHFLDMHNAAAKSVFLATLRLRFSPSLCLLNTLVAHQTFSLYRSVCNSNSSSSSSSYGSNSKARVDAVNTRLVL
jgi:hypothetical protein